MLVGVPREIKDNEFRVGLTPSAVRELVSHGHQVMVEAGAGAVLDLDDERYRTAGAEVVPDAASIYGRAELVVKVKEPQPLELAMLRDGQVLFTYLHLAPDAAQNSPAHGGVVGIHHLAHQMRAMIDEHKDKFQGDEAKEITAAIEGRTERGLADAALSEDEFAAQAEQN